VGNIADIRILTSEKRHKGHEPQPLAFINQSPELAAVGRDGRRQAEGEGMRAQLLEDGYFMLNVLGVGVIAIDAQNEWQRLPAGGV
jgi:hypothetical protein